MNNQIDHAMTATNTNFASSIDNDMNGDKKKFGDNQAPLDTNIKFSLSVVN